MSLAWLLIIVLIIVAIGSLPTWGYHSYGPYPSGIIVILVVILLVFLLSGRL